MEKEIKPGTRTKKKKLVSKQKFLKAVGTILKKEGYQKLGVNRVAEVAGVDKSSLYYHFGSFDNLLEQYVLVNDYWLGVFKEPMHMERGTNIIDTGKEMILHQFDSVIRNEELQAFLRWELSENKGIPKYIAELREEMGQDMLQAFQQYFKDTDIDLEMVAAIMISSIYYLILHRNQSTFCNIDINKKEDEERFKKTISKIVDLLVEDAGRSANNQQPTAAT